MSHLKFNKLCINGREFQGAELMNFCELKLKSTKTANWEVPIFQFVVDWLDEKEEIQVKTSGSTGEPKLIQLQKKHMINSAMATANALGLEAGQTALLALPAEYIAGKMMIVRTMVCHLNLILSEPSANPLKNRDEKIDYIALVPLQLRAILKSKNQTNSLQKIKKVLIGGGAIDEALIQKISQFPNDFYSSYGMTETCTHIALRKLSGTSPDKYYRSLPDVKISTDQRACLLIDAPHVSQQQLVTNDLAIIYSETQFEIKGRYDHIINSGGIKFSPEKIEAKLKVFIRQNFLITSIPDHVLGEKIILVIEDHELNLSELFQLWKQIESALDLFEIPKLIEFINPFTFTATGKIDRIKMKQILRKKLKC